MKVVIAILALGLFVSTASAYFSEGVWSWRRDFLLLARANLVTFDEHHKKHVFQFNACKDHYNIKINQIALMQARGKAMDVKTIRGSAGKDEHFIALELSNGEGLANYDVKIWGEYLDEPVTLNHETSVQTGSDFIEC